LTLAVIFTIVAPYLVLLLLLLLLLLFLLLLLLSLPNNRSGVQLAAVMAADQPPLGCWSAQAQSGMMQHT
jgi:hypothetical protein